MARIRKPNIKNPSTTYERKMAEAVAEYKQWVASKQKVSVRKILDFALPSGSIK